MEGTQGDEESNEIPDHSRIKGKKVNITRPQGEPDAELGQVEDKDDEISKKSLSIDPKEKSKWITKDIAESLGRDFYLKIILRDIVYYIIFLVIVSVVCFGSVSKTDYYLTKALKQAMNHDAVMGVRNVKDFWKYIDEDFVDRVYWDTWYGPESGTAIKDVDDKKILYENKLIGVPRIRQVKVRNDSCVVHRYFAFAFYSCYGRYSQSVEDTNAFGLKEGTAWTYSESDSTSKYGYVSNYGNGGFYQDLATNAGETNKMIAELKRNFWIGRATRAVIINFSVYNANLNVFCVINLLFEYPPTGGVIPSSRFETLKLIRYFDKSDYYILAAEVFMLLYIIYYTMEEVRDMIFLRWSYFYSFWSYIDLSIIAMGYLILSLTIYRIVLSYQIISQFANNQDRYCNLEYMSDKIVILNNTSAIMLFIVYAKVFKFINFNRTMGQLNITLSRCRKDVFGFSLMFLIIFVAFAALGYLLFGNEAEDFNGFAYSMLTLLKTVLGDFDYRQIEKANPILAPFYFLLFIFLVFFVLLNMFLAIINDTYTDVKTEIALGPQETQMSEIVKRGVYNLFKKCGIKKLGAEIPVKNEVTITLDEIRTALKNCGFSDLEIEMFFARYNVDTSSTSKDFDLEKLKSELEGKYYRERESINEDEHPVVAIEDFIEQQSRLENIERTVGKLGESLKKLLQKLDSLESVRRSKIQPQTSKS